MPDDILKNAQKAIDDAAGSMQDSPQEPAPEPVTPEPPKPETPTDPPAPDPAPQPATPEQSPAAPVAAAPPPAPQEQSADQLVSSILEPKVPTTIVPPKGTPPPPGAIPPKKGGASKLVIAVIAILLLALPVGVYFISQQNQEIADTRSSAWGSGYQECSSSPGNPRGSCDAGYVCHCQDGNACTETACELQDVTEGPCGNQGREWCQNAFGPGYTCCYPQYQCGPDNTGCIPRDNGDDDDTVPTATPTTVINQCTYLKIYKNNVQVTPSALLPGDQVVLAVKGSGSPAKARFRVNGGAWAESTNTNSNAEYTRNYTVPDGITQFVIESEVFVDGVWK